MEELDGLGYRSNALLAWYFVSALRCIALRYTVSSVPFREIVRPHRYYTGVFAYLISGT